MDQTGLPAKTILDLDDNCLHRVLTFLEPLPDRFNAGATCKVWTQMSCTPSVSGRARSALSN
jgi:hypothetical protein